MTRLKTNALRTISAAMLISVLAAVTGCSDRKPDIDYDLIGGTYEAVGNEYKFRFSATVQIPLRKLRRNQKQNLQPVLFPKQPNPSRPSQR